MTSLMHLYNNHISLSIYTGPLINALYIILLNIGQPHQLCHLFRQKKYPQFRYQDVLIILLKCYKLFRQVPKFSDHHPYHMYMCMCSIEPFVNQVHDIEFVILDRKG